MKNLKEYLLPHKELFENTDRHSNKIYLDNPICIREDNTVIDDYYEFINVNNIEEISEESYRFYLDSIYDKYYPYYDSEYSYKDYTQKLLNIDETLNRSWDSKQLVKKISDKYKVTDVKYVNIKSEITQFNIYFDDNINDILDDKEFWNILHLSNYYIKTVIDNENGIILEPYKPKDITDYIYNDCKGIIYHVTRKSVYDKIKNSELSPKWKGEWDKLKRKPYNIWRDGRIFFIANPNIDKVENQLKSIKNTSPKLKNDSIFLKIDLNKYRNKLVFRIDSSAYGYDAYFTEEPIPGYCIEKFNLNSNENE